MPLKFLCTTKTVTIAHCSPKTLDQIKQYLTVAVANQYHVLRRAKKRGWDGTTKFLNPRINSFSRGLWPQVKWLLDEHNLDYEFKKVTPALLPQISKLEINANLILRPNQAEALNKWLKRDGFGVVWAPPGFGKTELAAGALCVLNKQYKRALFIVNGLDLLLQTKERFELRLKCQIGIIGGSQWAPSRITVATIQTLYSAIKDKNHEHHKELNAMLKATDFIIVDEVHHARSKQIRSILSRANARYCLGLSARPFHAYEKDIQRMTAEDAIILAYLGPVVYHETATDLIEKGQLARPRVLLIPILHPLADEMKWADARKQLYTNQEMLAAIAHLTKAAASADQATLVISGSSLTFNHRIYETLKANQVNVIELCGAVDKELRQDARHDLNTSALRAIVATTIFDEGVDIPNLRQLILGYGGKSLIKLEQRMGRGLRKKQQGKNVAVVVDFIAYGNKHLEKHSRVRIKRYLEEEGYDLYLVNPEKHSRYIRRILKGKATNLNQLPDANYYKQLAATQAI